MVFIACISATDFESRYDWSLVSHIPLIFCIKGVWLEISITLAHDAKKEWGSDSKTVYMYVIMTLIIWNVPIIIVGFQAI